MKAKKDVKILLKAMQKQRREMIRNIEEDIIKPLKNDISLLNEVLQNRATLKEYKHHAKVVNDLLIGLFGTNPNKSIKIKEK